MNILPVTVDEWKKFRRRSECNAARRRSRQPDIGDDDGAAFGAFAGEIVRRGNADPRRAFGIDIREGARPFRRIVNSAELHRAGGIDPGKFQRKRPFFPRGEQKKAHRLPFLPRRGQRLEPEEHWNHALLAVLHGR